MVLPLVFVGKQQHEPARPDEGERRDLVDGIAGGQRQAAQGHRLRGRAVVQFNPVGLPGRRVGHPFIEGEVGRGGEGGRAIGSFDRGLRQHPRAPHPA
jgi:hypothetical protein